MFSLTVRTLLLAIQPAIQPAASISTKVIDDDYKWFLIKFGTLIKISLFYPSFCFNWIYRHKHEIALSAQKLKFFYTINTFILHLYHDC